MVHDISLWPKLSTVASDARYLKILLQLSYGIELCSTTQVPTLTPGWFSVPESAAEPSTIFGPKIVKTHFHISCGVEETQERLLP